ncbi:MAG: hypothetical protein IJ151_09785 [Bacteroidales bacterium]|nr:hypothetical protein [Bacteroidales bacterium]MBQ9186141.1 hypothetical protein [Bacteroidales bacterium]
MKKFLLVLGLLIAGAIAVSAQNLKSITSQVREISDADWTNFKIVRPVVIDFYADWCGPCRKLGPHLDRLSIEYKGRVDFLRINVDKNNKWASEYGIKSIPYLLWVSGIGDDGVLDSSNTLGYMDYDKLKNLVETLLKNRNKTH